MLMAFTSIACLIKPSLLLLPILVVVVVVIETVVACAILQLIMTVVIEMRCAGLKRAPGDIVLVPYLSSVLLGIVVLVVVEYMLLFRQVHAIDIEPTVQRLVRLQP